MIESEGASLLFKPHARLLRWAMFDPPLRVRTVPACCHREVRCRDCGGALVGTTRDPIDAIHIAWRHAKEIRRARRQANRRPR